MSNAPVIVLASASPRRKELLALAGLKFTVDAGDYEEDLSLDLKPHDLAKFLSREKARAVSHKYQNALIIAADTFIVFRNELLGKPHTAREASRMLTLLSGKSHVVITGYTVLDTGSRRSISRSVETKVWFKRLSRDEILAYVKTGEPLDKAGAYAIQGKGALIVKKIEGDYCNVIGLPLAALAETLRRCGVNLL